MGAPQLGARLDAQLPLQAQPGLVVDPQRRRALVRAVERDHPQPGQPFVAGMLDRDPGGLRE